MIILLLSLAITVAIFFIGSMLGNYVVNKLKKQYE
jgi:hypothetical protein